MLTASELKGAILLKQGVRNARAKRLGVCCQTHGQSPLMPDELHIQDWDLYFFKIANLVSLKSKDPSSKFGVVIEKDRRILGVGFNGFPIGVNDTRLRYSNRETKYSMIVHAEINAILSAAKGGQSLVGATLYVQAICCCDCAKSIIQSGIKTVKYLSRVNDIFIANPKWRDSFEITKTMLKESKVKLEAFTLIDNCLNDKLLIGGNIIEV